MTQPDIYDLLAEDDTAARWAEVVACTDQLCTCGHRAIDHHGIDPEAGCLSPRARCGCSLTCTDVVNAKPSLSGSPAPITTGTTTTPITTKENR